MKEEYVIKLTEEEKVIVEQALYFAKVEYEKKGLEERSKESGSGIHTVVANRLMNKAYKFNKLFFKFLDLRFTNV